MFVTPAFAQTGVGASPDIFVSILPFVLIFVIMYFLIIRPQRTQLKKRAEMLAAIRRGDSVVTGGGLVGKVTKVAVPCWDRVIIRKWLSRTKRRLRIVNRARIAPDSTAHPKASIRELDKSTSGTTQSSPRKTSTPLNTSFRRRVSLNKRGSRNVTNTG